MSGHSLKHSDRMGQCAKSFAGYDVVTAGSDLEIFAGDDLHFLAPELRRFPLLRRVRFEPDGTIQGGLGEKDASLIKTCGAGAQKLLRYFGIKICREHTDPECTGDLVVRELSALRQRF